LTTNIGKNGLILSFIPYNRAPVYSFIKQFGS
jgi:hypothetical protein